MIEAAQDPKLLNTLKGHKDAITAVDFHPQGYPFIITQQSNSLRIQ